MNDRVGKPLGIGLLGGGDVGRQVHLEVLKCLPGTRLVAVAETDPTRLADALAAAGYPGARGFADYRELLDEPAVEAVIIALPNALHAPAALAALERGKHVYLEKPMATDLDDARRLVEARQRAGVVGMVGFHLRRNPHYAAARETIRRGRLGRIVAARSVFSDAPRPGRPAWGRGSPAAGGGALLDLGSHHADLLRFLLGQEVREIVALEGSLESEGDHAVWQCRLADGTLTQTLSSWGAVDEERFEVYGQAGKLTVDRVSDLVSEVSGPRYADGARLRSLVHGVRSLANAPYILRKFRSPWREPAYAPTLAAFVAAVRAASAGKPVSGIPTFEDGFRSLEIVLAARESARTGRVVALGAEGPSVHGQLPSGESAASGQGGGLSKPPQP